MSVVLTGDRPSGALHLGHYVGSIKTRLEMQAQGKDMYILIADTQALTDCFENPELVRKSVWQLAQDYAACGIDFMKSTVFIQSTIKALPEIAMYYMNLVTLSRVERNPTVKSELQSKSFAKNVPCGFVCYPIFQAADITCVNGTEIPVGEDQIPMIEQTNEIVRKFNATYNVEVLKECKAIISSKPRLVGIDGRAKASKSLNNCIFLNDSAEVVKQKVMAMYTDPLHIHVNDPGCVEGNVVFEYLDAFATDLAEIADLKAQYRKGGLGDVVIKKRLIQILEEVLEPMRERRAKIDEKVLKEMVYAGSKKTAQVADEVLGKIKEAMKLNFDF